MASITVCVRMRPFLPQEKNESLEKQRIYFQEKSGQVKVELTEQREKVFKFNNVFGPDIAQEGVYDGVQALNLVQRVVEGYHSTIFAYGQTGSGKTYTIEGGDTPETEGIIPKAIQDLFRTLEEKAASSERGYKIFLSFIQIYNEAIFDLMDPSDGKPLRMRWNKHQQFTVENMFEGQCRTADQALKWWRRGQKNKILGSHKMNNSSSRSHCLLTLRVQNFSLEDPSEQIESKLEIIDLAGSQRQKVTKATGVVFKQGIQINKSLFTLRQVIASLYETSTTGKVGIIPPYRDSKLTSLLKQSIGGNSYCVMIACLNPSITHYEQSLQTLTYASMASYISNIPVKNVDPKIKQNEQLKQMNSQLRLQIKKLQDHVKYLTKLLEGNECAECKKKTNLRSQTDITHRQDLYNDVHQPTGLVCLPKINERSFSNAAGSEVSSIVADKNYEYLSKERGGERKVLKSTKDIIESITMIRDLISSNSTLRQKIQSLKNHIEKQQKETFTLMKENQLLRERWEMVGGFAKPMGDSATWNELPAINYEKIMPDSKLERADRSDKMKLNSFNSQPGRLQTEMQLKKVSYNDFLKGKKKEKKDQRRRPRIHSQTKAFTEDSMLI